MLRKRILTSIFLLVLLVLVLNSSPFVFNTAIWSIGILAANEFLLLFPDYKERKLRWSVLSFLLFNIVINGLMPLRPLLYLSIFWWFLIVPLLLWQYIKFKKIISSWWVTIGMLFMIFVPAISSINKIFHDYGAISLVYFLSGIWISDIGAYFIGKKYGELPLAIKISPKKTKEGFWGGLYLSLLWSIVWGGIFIIIRFKPLDFFRDFKKFLMMILLFIVTNYLATLGDLFESMLKRNAGVKDSGNILPGHGGWLDRMDSTLAVMPVLMLGLMLIN